MKTEITKIINDMLAVGAWKATKYISTKQIVRVVVRRYKGKTDTKKMPARNQNLEFTVTLGRPNYAERDFIKLLVKAKEPFPVKKVIFKK